MSTQTLSQYTDIILLCLSSLLLLVLHSFIIGWIVWAIGIAFLLVCTKQFRKDVFLLFVSLAILAFTPITTDISYRHIAIMGTTIGVALFFPYIVSRFIYKDQAVKFIFHHGRKWYKTEILYILLTAIVCYFVIPFYLKSTMSYLNWPAPVRLEPLVRFFLGTNVLGIWDELFFICTVLGVLRRFFPFLVANLFQGILFTAFLFELGFRGWGFFIIYPFALIQGYIFKRTESLFYIITIHLTIDQILFFSLLQLNGAHWLPKLFLTG